MNFKEGDKVETGKFGTPDYDTGRIVRLFGHSSYAEVAWDSGVKTRIHLSNLQDFLAGTWKETK